ncbi:hypothetical protein J6590_076284 [Homalodisca vitripennis]|nr:hypothetical protein J6590_076284 [Homalodisca vitripennis]
MLVNAHYLYNEVRTSSGENKMPLYDFRLEVIDKLLPDVPKPPRPLKRRRVPHVPSRITEKVACGKRSIQKRCRNVMDSLGCVSHIVLTNSMTNEAYLGEDERLAPGACAVDLLHVFKMAKVGSFGV